MKQIVEYVLYCNISFTQNVDRNINLFDGNYHNVSVGYSNKHVLNKIKFLNSIFDDSFNGMFLEYNYGIKLFKKESVYIELGIRPTYSIGEELVAVLDVNGFIDKCHYSESLQIHIPIIVKYMICNNCDGFFISPFFGVYYKNELFLRQVQETGVIHNLQSSEYRIYDKNYFGFQSGLYVGFSNVFIKGIFSWDLIKNERPDCYNVLYRYDLGISVGYCF